MDEKLSNPAAAWPGSRSTAADVTAAAESPAEYELRLRSTERVRALLQRRTLRCSAPQDLVVRIRQSLIVFRE